MPDIEDLADHAAADPDAAAARRSLGSVAVKSFRRRAQPGADEAGADTAGSPDAAGDGHFLPGRASVFVKTWGCGHNNSDGEYMAGLLAAEGYNVILEHNRADEADVWVLNSCTVKGPSQQTFVNDIQRGRTAGKRVVVAGCVPQASPSGEDWRGLSVIGVQQIDSVVAVVEETLKGNMVRMMRDAKAATPAGGKRKAGGAPLDLPKVRRNPFIEIIPINTGCLNQCTYCKTKHARGDLGSYTPEEIIARVESVLDEGVREIWLTSEDTGAYGRDIGVTIVDLLWGILAAMERHPSKTAMLRVGMTNPPYILEHLHEIARVLNHPRVFAFLHVPVQSGSTRVLSDMRRLYTIEDFERVVDVLRENVPGVTIATDVICGFPTETDQDFDETMRVLEKYRFPVLHISQFYPRPGTPAARMKRLQSTVVKARSRRATTFFESYTPYDALLGSEQTVLVTEQSADGEHYVGHNKPYHQILVPKDPALMGRTFRVRITKCAKFYMRGELVDGELERLRREAQEEAASAGGAAGAVLPQRIPKLVRIKRTVTTLPDGERDGHDAAAAAEDAASVASRSAQPAPAAQIPLWADEQHTDPETQARSDGAMLSLGSAARRAAAPASAAGGKVPPQTNNRILLRIGAHAVALGIAGALAANASGTRWTLRLGAVVLGALGTELLLAAAAPGRT
ncbi:hypothetical protein HK105_208988 [Polyrhizophydium stewartii]|uniref:Threonylcarbamoyladenosine tRNA methylthiotransferase n=1 Tax=Polyrhizophydium stewartii TaxID=2732419 RepID=A0ABR4MWB5_9FUNG|nr:hypothetical protein HK105_006129 [Polyrhizophydium stewartii]